MPETPRLLFVHAHPDDESLANGATIAHYTARGAEVRVVTCTLGEEGEVIGDRWAELAVDRADQLGGYRIGELTAALRELDQKDLLPGWMIPPQDEFDFGFADSDIDAVVQAAPDALAAKTAALAAHETQLVVGPTGRALALSNNLALPIVAEEHYVLVAG